MNVLILNLGKEYGGAEKVIHNIKEYSSYKIYLGLINDTKFYEQEKNYKNILILEKNKKYIFKNINKLYKFVRENNIDVIHCHGVFAEIIGVIIKVLSGKKLITTIHSRADFDTENFFKGKTYLFIQKVLKIFNKNYIVVSDELEKLFSSSKTIKLYNGIPQIKEVEKCESNKGEINIISVGRLSPVKAHDNLIDAIKNLKNKNIKINCTIIGDGELRGKLQCKVNNLGLNDYIEFKGFIDDIGIHLNKADCIIMHSNMEGMPIILLEAMSCKTAIITNTVGGIKNILSERDFIKLKSNKSEDIEAGIVNFIESNDEFKREIVNNAYENFLKNFSIETFITNQDKIYREC